MKKYDLCIIGGGPAGYAAAMRAIDFGKKVILVEKNRLGGAGIYDGALASKAMWEFSEKVRIVKEMRAEGSVDVTYQEVSQTVNEALFDRKFQLSCHLKLLQEETSNPLITYVKAKARLLSKNTVEVAGEHETEVIYADYIILATGSRPRPLPNVIIDEKNILTSDGIHHLHDFPKSMVIVGAGVVGCEYATIFSNFGKTKVYMIDRASRILPFEDDDLAAIVNDSFKKEGVIIHGEARLERMEVVKGMVEYEVSYPGGKREQLRVEKALLSIGRVPNVEDLGLENAGVKVNDKGFIETHDTQTNVPNIYAVGDITGSIQLVNVGEREGRHAVVRIFDGPIPPIDYSNISTIMFLNPEVAAVGLNEQMARKKGLSFKLAKIDYSCIARAIAMRKTTGFFKILVTNDDEMQLLGMRAVGEHASSAIQAVALLIHMKKGIGELTHMMHPHPAITEGIQECCRMLLGKSIYKSPVFKDKLSCYSCEDGVCTPLQTI